MAGYVYTNENCIGVQPVHFGLSRSDSESGCRGGREAAH